MNTTDHPHTPDVSDIRNPDVAHEASDVNVRAIFWFIVILTAFAVVVHLVVWGLFDLFENHAEKSEPPPRSLLGVGVQRLPPEPRLQLAPGHESHPLDDLKKLREEEDSRLQNYGWVDQQRGIVHIPIDQAKKLLIERSQSASPQTVWPDETMPGGPSSGRMPERRNQ
ncbi:MAG TPA: hypothetical protein VNQ79_17610 [Blastocatellia bacterium]|nr:hypothetical protein [Blastocatellia bacterium]